MAVPRYYAPALRKKEFLRKKPHGNYANYLKYLNAQRVDWNEKNPYVRQLNPGWVNPNKNGAGKPPPSTDPLAGIPNFNNLLKFAWSGLETPQQLEARANRMAQTQLNYQKKLLDEEYRMAQEDARLGREGSQAAGRAAAAMNAELMGRIGSGYSGAAGEISGMAGALGAAMNEASAADVARANQGLAAIGVNPVIAGGPVGQPGVAGAQQAAVEIFRGGTLPANQMGAAGVAGQTGLYGLISSQNLRATQEAEAGYLQATREASRQKASAIKALAAGRPAAAMQFLENLQNAQRNQMILAQNLIGARNAKKIQDAQLAANKAAAGRAAEEHTWKGQQVDPTRSEAAGHIVLVNGNEPKENGAFIPVSRLYTARELQAIKAGRLAMASQRLKNQLAVVETQMQAGEVDVTKSLIQKWVVDRQGKFVRDEKGNKIPSSVLKKLQAQGKGGNAGGLTPGQYSDLVEWAQEKLPTWFFGYGKDKEGKRVPVTEAGDFDPEDPDTYGKGRLGYDRAISLMMQRGLSKPVAMAMANEYYTQRGALGRPLLSDVEITAAKRIYGQQRLKRIFEKLKALDKAGMNHEFTVLLNKVLAGNKNIDLTPVNRMGPPEEGDREGGGGSGW